MCYHHGGDAPQVKAKAQRRLQQAADALVQRLLGFALDGNVTDPVELQASATPWTARGLVAKQAVAVKVKPGRVRNVPRRRVVVLAVTQSSSATSVSFTITTSSGSACAMHLDEHRERDVDYESDRSSARSSKWGIAWASHCSYRAGDQPRSTVSIE